MPEVGVLIWGAGPTGLVLALWLPRSGPELTPNAFLFTQPLNEHERVLEHPLNSIGIFVERQTKLKEFLINQSTMSAMLIVHGVEPTYEASYLARISRDPPTKSGSTLTFEDVLPEVKEGFKTGEQEVKWCSTYRSHYNVSSSFRSDKAFIVGDAAHTHSPIGGQCMNVGVMYAINLTWKPANVTEQPSMTEEAKNALLGTYESER
ncbi:FAD_binding_3 domain-containing protein [Penicillium ucsense]|uniref:FAD_binding_3 domain-containing protein n=1 Tax=Penicillium ucsense TaxID=2839758 RepID=A0A8J8W816_9EURO|nr:FAD_binding_3 domain-containing protein [Penicillium ucsense]KAF7737720.1 FAD_binding_3 domain-containing protein [Penicillium ucsense]